MSGRAPTFPWQHWVFRDLKVQGFNLRRWMQTRRSVAACLTEYPASGESMPLTPPDSYVLEESVPRLVFEGCDT
jgi:hypothetical protein